MAFGAAARLVTAVFVVSIAAACVSITPVTRVATSATLLPIPTTAPTSSGAGASASSNPLPDASAEPDTERTPTPKHTPRPRPTAAPPTVNANDPACFDDAYNLEGFAWDQPYRWHFNSGSTPTRYDAADVLVVLKKGIDNIISERNDCARPDRIFAEATYDGDVGADACGSIGDGVNTITFGAIPRNLSQDTIAYTCPYYFRDTHDIAEADIVLSDDLDWSLSKDDCIFEELLEPTVTHEMGHVLGMDHVSDRDHPDLTMSTTSNGPCDDAEATLGLGDMLGLEKLYPGD